MKRERRGGDKEGERMELWLHSPTVDGLSRVRGVEGCVWLVVASTDLGELRGAWPRGFHGRKDKTSRGNSVSRNGTFLLIDPDILRETNHSHRLKQESQSVLSVVFVFFNYFLSLSFLIFSLFFFWYPPN